MLPNTNDILFATDLSKNADNAFGHALRMAGAHDAKVHVLHVAAPLSQDAKVTMQMFFQDDGARKKATEERMASFKTLLKDNQQSYAKSLSGDEKGLFDRVASVELAHGEAAEEILSRAATLACDLIVMASHEQETGHTFIGSVVKRVLRRSTVPVLIVPGNTIT